MAIMLTTNDNPYDPFTQFDEWQAFDEGKGYYTNELLARLSHLGSSLTKIEEDSELENAIDEIVEINVLGIYKKVTRDSES